MKWQCSDKPAASLSAAISAGACMTILLNRVKNRNCTGIVVNISVRKSGTERTKKHKKRELVFCPTASGRNSYCSTPLNGICPSYDNPGYLYPGPYAALTKSQLYKQAKHTQVYNFAERISFAEHWKLVAKSSEFHLTLSRVHLERIFSN